MIIYIIFIVLLYFLSLTRFPKEVYAIVFLLLYIFLCFGYMCGSDWRIYETEYYNNFSNRLVEPGYMFISNLFSNCGVNFWLFFILFKSFCFISYYRVFRIRSESSGTAFLWMFFLCSFGFYLFIDCPFRNLIAMGIIIVAIQNLLHGKLILFYGLTLIACSFHLSNLIFLMLPFIHFEKMSNKILCAIYFSVLFLLATHIDVILLKMILAPIPYLYERLFFYEETSLIQGNVFSVGLILRLICLFFMLIYRKWIHENYDKSGGVFNLCFCYLLLSLISYSIPIMFRMPFSLSPYYVLMIFFISKCFSIRNRYVFRYFYFLVAIIITIKTVTSRPYYVPYTNILPYVIKGEFPSYEYRDAYNFTESPYKD